MTAVLDATVMLMSGWHHRIDLDKPLDIARDAKAQC